MKRPAGGSSPQTESRLFPAVAVLALPIVLAILPDRFRMMPRGLNVIVAAGLIVPILAAGFAPAHSRWARVERWAIAIILPLAAAVMMAELAVLLIDMASKDSNLSGLTLLTTSIALWATNILVFALAYWQIDRGGPEGRTHGWRGRADFSFPRGDPSDGMPEDWQPVFADYLALGFNTAAAFSPTDVLPLTPRAKMLMMTESLISLITVIAVGARAINILGS